MYALRLPVVFTLLTLALTSCTSESIDVLPPATTHTLGTQSQYRSHSQQFFEFPLPTSNAFPARIATGADGALWFSERGVNRIARIDSRGRIVEYQIPVRGSAARLTLGRDGAIWFAHSSNAIGRITTTGAITLLKAPTAGGLPIGITSGPDGALWYTDASRDRIGRVSTSGTFTEFPIPTVGAGLGGITTGSDGALWFAEQAGDKIGRITLGGAVTEFAVPSGSGPIEIASDNDGALWFANILSNTIGRITTQGAITIYPLPPTVAPIVLPPGTADGPGGIALGPDGAMWFTREGAGMLGRISRRGHLRFYAIPTLASVPLGLAFARDGNLWFTEVRANQVGVFTGIAQSETRDRGDGE